MSVLWVLFSSLSLFDHRNRICTVKRIMLCFSVSWRCSCLGVGCKRLLQLLPNIFIDEQHTVSDPLILQCLISLFYMEQNKTLILKVTRYSLSAWGIAFEIFVHLFLIISRININNTNSFLAKEVTGWLLAGLEPVGTRSKQNCHCWQFTGVIYVSPTKCSEFTYLIIFYVCESCISYVHIRSNWLTVRWMNSHRGEIVDNSWQVEAR